MESIVKLALIPIILLNFFSGLVGGVWLLFEGQWAMVAFGFLYGFVGVMALSLILLPGMLFAIPAATAFERNRPTLAALLGAPSLTWTLLVLTASCVFIFSRIATIGDGGIPFLLWGYSVALSPWTHMASKEASDSPATGATAMAAQLGVVSMMVATVVNPLETQFDRLVWWFAPFPILALLLLTLTGISAARAHAHSRDL